MDWDSAVLGGILVLFGILLGMMIQSYRRTPKAPPSIPPGTKKEDIQVLEKMKPGQIYMVEDQPFQVRMISSTNYGLDSRGTEIILESV